MDFSGDDAIRRAKNKTLTERVRVSVFLLGNDVRVV